MASNERSRIKMGFEERKLRISIAKIQPLRLIQAAVAKTAKYAQIATSIREVGIIEPPVVARDRSERGKYLLLDGHLRIDILKSLGETEAVCLVATDDEAFTYNKRVSRLAIIQEHSMILKAVEQGVPEDRIAKALNVDVGNIRRKRHLLDGICPEAAELLKDKHVAILTFGELKKMLPVRQVEAAQLMVAMNKYSISYARSLVGATPRSQFVDWAQPKRMEGLSDDQLALMEQESAQLDREFRLIEQSYGADHLDLVIVTGYMTKLIENARVARFMAQHYPELLSEFQKIAGHQAAA